MTHPPDSERPCLALLYGTRPQVIKASALAAGLTPQWDVFAVDTGQHYDYALNALLYAQLGVRQPDVCLDAGSGDHATQTATVLTRAAAVLAGRGPRHPRVAVVVGDTNSTLGCALAAAKLRIPVVHVEAGLHCADALMAEEINRRAVDAISAVCCTPSAAATERLRRGRAPVVVVETGDVAFDVLTRVLPRLPPAAEATAWPLPPGTSFVLATIHRAELVDDVAALTDAVHALGRIRFPVVFAVHPRTNAVLEAAGVTTPPGVHRIPPLGYLETIAAVRDAAAVVTDSGGLQREAYWLGTPCITLRSETEWTETVAVGANRLVSRDDLPALASAVHDAVHARATWNRTAYGDGTAVARVASAVAGFR
ncbi:MAG: UDP-N-acetylglucosamine 2-epimerase [Candidatus Eremiobacteraeota bacterium]|nr:UDP-N-acetylglucosamine 2-epimerase [Candidatus Eremiobacteraeota bacterium]